MSDAGAFMQHNSASFRFRHVSTENRSFTLAIPRQREGQAREPSGQRLHRAPQGGRAGAGSPRHQANALLAAPLLHQRAAGEWRGGHGCGPQLSNLAGDDRQALRSGEAGACSGSAPAGMDAGLIEAGVDPKQALVRSASRHHDERPVVADIGHTAPCNVVSEAGATFSDRPVHPTPTL
jgi:hypothetical protein